jgi:hypothetical protein
MMGGDSPQSVLERAPEQAFLDKRQAMNDARAAERRTGEEAQAIDAAIDAE